MTMDEGMPTVDEQGRLVLLPTDRVAVARVTGAGEVAVVQARVASVEGDMVFVTFKGESEVKMYDRSNIMPLYRRMDEGLLPFAVTSKNR